MVATPHSALRRSPAFAIRFVADQVRRSVAAALAEHGLSWCDYTILVVAGESTGLTQGALSERTAIDRSRTSETLLNLEEEMLIVRDTVFDRRKRQVYLTESGRDALVTATRAVEEAERAALLPLDPRERARLAALMARLIPPERDIFGFIRA